MVLGASGFIGGAIAIRLAAEGHQVGRPGRSEANLGDPQAMADAAAGFTHVVNAAGIVSPRAHPRALRWTHVAGMENLLNACRHSAVQRLVHMSCTDVTLSNQDRVHWDEQKSISGKPYGARACSLQLAEELALSASGLEVTSIRPTWVWGPGDVSRLPQLVREGLDGGIRLVGDGRNYLSTTYIDHVAQAALAALQAEQAPGRAFHVADATFQHARDFFSALSQALGLPKPRETTSLPLAWPMARLRGGGEELLQRGRSNLFDFSMAVGKLGYEPDVTMEDGLAALARWVEEQGGLEAVAALERPPPGASSVDAQVEAAGGD